MQCEILPGWQHIGPARSCPRKTVLPKSCRQVSAQFLELFERTDMG